MREIEQRQSTPPDEPTSSYRSTPCPWCRKRIDMAKVDALWRHIYIPFRGPQPTTCAVKLKDLQARIEKAFEASWQRKYSEASYWMKESEWRSEVKKEWKSYPSQVERAWLGENRRLSRAEIRRRQLRAGKALTKEQRRRGGFNQRSSDKASGGQRSTHNRWHVARGKRSPSCKFCQQEPAA